MCRSIYLGELLDIPVCGEGRGTNGNRLQGEVLKNGIEILRASIDDIRDVFARFPDVEAVFNCTGLGSFSLKGVEDKLLYPTRVCRFFHPVEYYQADKQQGQVMLVENPKTLTKRMYFRSPQRVNKDTTYIFLVILEEELYLVAAESTTIGVERSI
jgi:hypothetical protein